MKSHGDESFADELAMFIRGNENALSKEQIFHILEFLVEGLEHFMRDMLDERSYIEFLINCGLTEKARSLIESSESLDEESKFSLYLHIDKGRALEFAYRNGAFSSLINYYHETGAHDEVVRLFAEAADDASKNWKLKENPFLYLNILDSINKSEKKKKPEKLLRALFEKCFSFNYFGLCMNTGLMLGDKELLRKLIDKESGYYFNVDEKIKVLEYLQMDYGKEVLREFKKLASTLINEMGDHEYNKAADCVFLLRDSMGEDAWNEYVKGLYRGHLSKRNLWKAFRDRGIYFKMKKGEVTLNEQ